MRMQLREGRNKTPPHLFFSYAIQIQQCIDSIFLGFGFPRDMGRGEGRGERGRERGERGEG